MASKKTRGTLLYAVSWCFIASVCIAGCGGGGGSSGSAVLNSFPQQQAASALPTGTGLSAMSNPKSGSTKAPAPNPTTTTLTGTAVNALVGPLRVVMEKDVDGEVVVYYAASQVQPAGATIQKQDQITASGAYSTPAPNSTYGTMRATQIVIMGNSSPTPSPTPHPSASPTPTSSPTSGPGPYHISTWANDTYWSAGSLATSAQVATYVSYAESGLGNTKALDDCNAHPGTCKSVYYFDPNVVYSSITCPLNPSAAIIKAASENWFVHWTGYTDAAHRIATTYQQSCNGNVISIPMWRTNDGTTGVQGWWRSELQSNANGYDILFMDNTKPKVINQYFACLPLPSYCYTTQEVADDAAVVAGHVSFVNSVSHVNGQPWQYAFNSINFNGQQVSPGLSLFGATGRFFAGVCEGCAVSNGTYLTSNYSRILSTMAAINATQGAFVLHSTDSSPAGSSTEIAERQVTTALVWLGYSQGHTIIWEDLEDGSKNLSVWAEDLIYPSGPVQTMVSGASDLQVSSGVYRREFKTCYQASVFFGRCAAIVNSTNNAVPVSSAWLSQSYTHLITLSGGDLLSGGTASVKTATFRPNTTTVPGNGALLVAR